jgi:hypothetical protein
MYRLRIVPIRDFVGLLYCPSYQFISSHMRDTKRAIASASVSLVFIALGFAFIANAATLVQLAPNGVGNYNQFTTVGTTTHYLNVDEATCNGLTDYNQTSTVGNRDSYAVSLSGVPDGAVITSVAIKPCASRVTSGGADPVANVFYRWNGANSTDSGAYALTGTTPVELATTTYPVSLTKTSTSSLEIGSVLASGARGIRLSRVAVQLTYDTVPAAPSNLTSSVSTTSLAVLGWNDNSSNETSFKIERATSSFVFTQIASTTANTTGYVDSGLSSGTYFYRVRASNAIGNSPYSNIATTTIP